VPRTHRRRRPEPGHFLVGNAPHQVQARVTEPVAGPVLARPGSAARRAVLTDQLVLLYDGMMVGAQLDQGPGAARRARAAARQLLDGPAPAP
jgi:hypothetical protein